MEEQTCRKLFDCMVQLGILTEEGIRKVYYHLLDAEEKEASLAFFQAMEPVMPDSYEVRRCFAESLMQNGRFAEAAQQWKYIMTDLKHDGLNVLERYFHCCLSLGRMDEMQEAYQRMQAIALEHDLSVRCKDLFLSYCNENYEVQIQSEVTPLPASLKPLTGQLYLKRKQTCEFHWKSKTSTILSLDINYKMGGGNTSLPNDSGGSSDISHPSPRRCRASDVAHWITVVWVSRADQAHHGCLGGEGRMAVSCQ